MKFDLNFNIYFHNIALACLKLTFKDILNILLRNFFNVLNNLLSVKGNVLFAYKIKVYTGKTLMCRAI